MHTVTLAPGALGVLELLEVVVVVRPVRRPERDDDRLLLGVRALQLGQHGGRGAVDDLVLLVQAVVLEDLALEQGHLAGARLDAGDLAAELGRLALEVLQGVDALHVGGHGELQGRLVVPGAEVVELLAVLLPVLGVGRGQPAVRLEVDVALGQRGVQRARVVLFGLDLVAALLQDLLPQEGGGDALIPGDIADADLLALADVLAVGRGRGAGAAAEHSHAARGEREDDDADHGDDRAGPVGPDLQPLGGAQLGGGAAAERGDLGAQGARHAVQVDREDHDGHTGLGAQAHVELADGLVDVAAESAGADHAGDRGHGQAEHDDLVDTGHDGGQGERELDAQQRVARRGAERVGGLDQFLVDLPDAQLGHAHARCEREDQRGDDAGGGAGAEEQDRRDEVDHRGQRLHEVQDGPDQTADAVRAGRPDADGYGDHKRDDGRHQDKRQGDHRVLPQFEGVDERESGEREDTGERAAQPEGDHGEDAREEQRFGGLEDGVDAVVEAEEDGLAEVEQPRHVGGEPVDRVVDPAAELDPRHGRSPSLRPCPAGSRRAAGWRPARRRGSRSDAAGGRRRSACCPGPRPRRGGRARR